MEAELEQYRSECFRTPVVGESVMVHDAADGTAYRLTVLGARSETLELPDDDGWERPNCFCLMTYRLTPKAENFFLDDCAEGDHPRRRARPPIDPERTGTGKEVWAGTAGGRRRGHCGDRGCRRPTAVFCTVRGETEETNGAAAACSACYFEPVQLETITWQASFCRKPCADADVKLL